jgi:hypothetical protein
MSQSWYSKRYRTPDLEIQRINNILHKQALERAQQEKPTSQLQLISIAEASFLGLADKFKAKRWLKSDLTTFKFTLEPDKDSLMCGADFNAGVMVDDTAFMANKIHIIGNPLKVDGLEDGENLHVPIDLQFNGKSDYVRIKDHHSIRIKEIMESPPSGVDGITLIFRISPLVLGVDEDQFLLSKWDNNSMTYGMQIKIKPNGEVHWHVRRNGVTRGVYANNQFTLIPPPAGNYYLSQYLAENYLIVGANKVVLGDHLLFLQYRFSDNTMRILKANAIDITVGNSPDAMVSPFPFVDPIPPTPPAAVKIPVLSATVSGSDAGHPLQDAFDNNLTTYWAHSSRTASMMLDLGVPQRITALDIAWKDGNTKRYLYDIFVGGQADISKMDKVTPTTRLSSGTTINRERYTFPSERYARYVLLLGQGNQSSIPHNPGLTELWTSELWGNGINRNIDDGEYDPSDPFVKFTNDDPSQLNINGAGVMSMSGVTPRIYIFKDNLNSELTTFVTGNSTLSTINLSVRSNHVTGDTSLPNLCRFGGYQVHFDWDTNQVYITKEPVHGVYGLKQAIVSLSTFGFTLSDGVSTGLRAKVETTPDNNVTVSGYVRISGVWTLITSYTDTSANNDGTSGLTGSELARFNECAGHGDHITDSEAEMFKPWLNEGTRCWIRANANPITNAVSNITFTDSSLVEVETPRVNPPVPAWLDLNAMNAEVTAEGSQSPNLPKNIIDDNYNTRWANPRDFDNGTRTWVQIDLKVNKVVTRVDIAWYYAHLRRYRFSIMVSTDNTNWTQAYPFNGGENILSDKQSADKDFDTVPFQTPKLARYIRIYCWGNTTNRWASIWEVQVRAMEPGGTTDPQSLVAISEFDVYGFPATTQQDPFVSVYNVSNGAPNTDEYFTRLHGPGVSNTFVNVYTVTGITETTREMGEAYNRRARGERVKQIGDSFNSPIYNQILARVSCFAKRVGSPPGNLNAYIRNGDSAKFFFGSIPCNQISTSIFQEKIFTNANSKYKMGQGDAVSFEYDGGDENNYLFIGIRNPSQISDSVSVYRDDEGWKDVDEEDLCGKFDKLQTSTQVGNVIAAQEITQTDSSIHGNVLTKFVFYLRKKGNPIGNVYFKLLDAQNNEVYTFGFVTATSITSSTTALTTINIDYSLFANVQSLLGFKMAIEFIGGNPDEYIMIKLNDDVNPSSCLSIKNTNGIWSLQVRKDIAGTFYKGGGIRIVDGSPIPEIPPILDNYSHDMFLFAAGEENLLYNKFTWHLRGFYNGNANRFRYYRRYLTDGQMINFYTNKKSISTIPYGKIFSPLTFTDTSITITEGGGGGEGHPVFSNAFTSAFNTGAP